MSNVVRWILVVLLVIFGIAAAVIAIFLGSLSMFGCTSATPGWVFNFLIVVAIINLAAAVVPAIMIVRRANGRRAIWILALGLIVSCAGYGIFALLLGQTC